MVAGLILTPVVSWLTPKLSKEKLDSLFACYEEKIVISKKHSLEED